MGIPINSDSLLPHQRNRVVAVIELCENKYQAWDLVKWTFQDSDYWLHRDEIKKLVFNFVYPQNQII